VSIHTVSLGRRARGLQSCGPPSRGLTLVGVTVSTVKYHEKKSVNDPDKLLIHIRRDKIERRRRERGDGLGERVGRNDCCFVRVVGRMRELQALDETEDNIMEICVRRKECPHRLMEGDVRGDMVSLFACCNKLRM